MPLSFLPKIIAKNLTDLSPELLRSRNIRLLMLDFDNTIVTYTDCASFPTATRTACPHSAGNVALTASPMPESPRERESGSA